MAEKESGLTGVFVILKDYEMRRRKRTWDTETLHLTKKAYF